MRFSFAAAGLLAMATSSLAQAPGLSPTKTFFPNFLVENDQIQAGIRSTIKWTPSPEYADMTASFKLLGGSTPETLEPVLVDGSEFFATGIPISAGQYPWTVPSNIAAKDMFGIICFLEGNDKIFQYTPHFMITGLSATNSAGDGKESNSVENGQEGNSTVAVAQDVQTDVPSPTKNAAVTSIAAPFAQLNVDSATKTSCCGAGPTALTNSTTKGAAKTGHAGIRPTPTPGAAPLVSAGLLSVFGGLAVAALAL